MSGMKSWNAVYIIYSKTWLILKSQNVVRTIFCQTESFNNKAHDMVTASSHHGIWLADALHRFGRGVHQPIRYRDETGLLSYRDHCYWQTRFFFFELWKFVEKFELGLKQVELPKIRIILVRVIEFLVYRTWGEYDAMREGLERIKSEKILKIVKLTWLKRVASSLLMWYCRQVIILKQKFWLPSSQTIIRKHLYWL